MARLDHTLTLVMRCYHVAHLDHTLTVVMGCYHVSYVDHNLMGFDHISYIDETLMIRMTRDYVSCLHHMLTVMMRFDCVLALDHTLMLVFSFVCTLGLFILFIRTNVCLSSSHVFTVSTSPFFSLRRCFCSSLHSVQFSSPSIPTLSYIVVSHDWCLPL